MIIAKFGIYEGNPVRWTPGDDGKGVSEAWWFAMDKWRPMDAAEIAMGAIELSEASFAASFPHLQDLPKAAFQAGASLD